MGTPRPPSIVALAGRWPTYTLQEMLKIAPKVVTTPHILTEVSNLLGQLRRDERNSYFAVFAQGITVLEELHPLSVDIAKMEEFRRFGITDAGLIALAQQHLIITADVPLSNYLATAGVDVLNFNQIRAMHWR